ncbi:MAG: sugar isomerase domain-containing protein [Chloroflexota bacterium]
MAGLIDVFHQHVMAQLQAILTEQAEPIEAAAATIADAIADEKDVYSFGSGHSELVAKEAMWRAGGLAPFIAIQDHTGGDAERIEGVAKLILGHYSLRPGGVMIVISNSGINPVPVEAAMTAKGAGLTTVAMCALAHSKDVPARHSSGEKLYDVADIVIDTHTPRGDTSVKLAQSGLMTGATSTLAGVFIMDVLTVRAAEILDERGIAPPVLVSANVPEGDAHNIALKQKYMPRMARWPVDTADMA